MSQICVMWCTMWVVLWYWSVGNTKCSGGGRFLNGFARGLDFQHPWMAEGGLFF